MSVLVRGSNKLVLEEADRSIHDALCVMRCLVKKKYYQRPALKPENKTTHYFTFVFVFLIRAVIAGGGAPEIELSLRLTEHANTVSGMEQYCFREYAQALEVIPFTLAENAGLNPIATVTELRNKHANGEIAAGINVRKVACFKPVQALAMVN